MKHIRAQMNRLKRTVLSSLKSSEEEGNKELDRLRQMIRKNEVECQETRMRVRREITELYEKHDLNVQLKEEMIGQLKNMQMDIFSCEPYEL